MVWPSTVAERNTLSTSDPKLSAVRYFSPPHVLTIYIYGVGVVRIILFSIILFGLLLNLSLMCCRALELVRTPLSLPASRWLNCGRLTAFLPIDHVALPGRLLLHSPILFERLVFSHG